MSFITSFLENGPKRIFQPKRAHADGDAILNRLAFLVGCVAIGLPLILLLGSLVLDSCFRDSISHFYYDQLLGPVFVGLLYFIGGFLIAYTGETFVEDTLSTVAGFGAFIVATVPTFHSGCELQKEFLSRVFVEYKVGPPIEAVQAQGQEFFKLFSAASNWHLIAAGILFVFLALYCLFVLKRVIPARHEQNGVLIESKRKRNRLYSYCGLTILACVALLVLKDKVGSDFLNWWNRLNLTFFVEAIALWAFGIAWFAKGRVFSTLNDG
ncbi:hypothetical protein M3P21_09740 [Ruegeria sp. 2012CJ41-6]|uniref:DUF998 domain-containing protein n=1 Tax=Ruegeria spongiae TaxID=2942209 RepID=A0ABT0Q1Q2_9RHOB|nr:hypothetical protein [Ruegeria spongiae]MCL6283809.1 hypothetical protein [Ruegeria spongiae]